MLAHHGQLEYGSPKLPMTLEAFLVHELDEIDSRVNSWLGHMSRAQGERWAEPTKGYESLLWKGPMPTEEGMRRGPAWKQHRKGKGEKKKRERAPQPSAAEAALTAGENVAAPVPELRERREPRPPREPREQREQRPPRAEGAHPEGERRGPGPRFLKRAEGGGAPRGGGGDKLTFKPFSALTEERSCRAPKARSPPSSLLPSLLAPMCVRSPKQPPPRPCPPPGRTRSRARRPELRSHSTRYERPGASRAGVFSIAWVIERPLRDLHGAGLRPGPLAARETPSRVRYAP